jgi:hypothetical protein
MKLFVYEIPPMKSYFKSRYFFSEFHDIKREYFTPESKCIGFVEVRPLTESEDGASNV